MKDTAWLIVCILSVILIGTLYSRTAHPAQAPWYAAVWLQGGSFRHTPQKTLDQCNAFLEEQRRVQRTIQATACVTKEQLDKLRELEKAKTPAPARPR